MRDRPTEWTNEHPIFMETRETKKKKIRFEITFKNWCKTDENIFFLFGKIKKKGKNERAKISTKRIQYTLDLMRECKTVCRYENLSNKNTTQKMDFFVCVIRRRRGHEKKSLFVTICQQFSTSQWHTMERAEQRIISCGVYMNKIKHKLKWVCVYVHTIRAQPKPMAVSVARARSVSLPLVRGRSTRARTHICGRSSLASHVNGTALIRTSNRWEMCATAATSRDVRAFAIGDTINNAMGRKVEESTYDSNKL